MVMVTTEMKWIQSLTNMDKDTLNVIRLILSKLLVDCTCLWQCVASCRGATSFSMQGEILNSDL